MEFSDLDICLTIIAFVILLITLIALICLKVTRNPTDFSLKKSRIKSLALVLFAVTLIASEANQNQTGFHLEPFIVALVTLATILFLDKLLPSLIAFCQRNIHKIQFPK